MNLLTSPEPASRHLHVVRDEESPPYDGIPSAPAHAERRHVTVIDDDVLEAVAARCGLAALGLYTLLERRANGNCTAYGSYQDWADMAGMTRRHIIRLMEQLVGGGWVEKLERTTANGMTRTNAWKLPFHQKPRTNGGDTASDMGGDMTSAFMSPLKSSSKVVKESKSKRETLIPDDFTLTTERLDYAVAKGLSRIQAEDLLEEMRGWSLAKGGKYLNWDAAWQNWVRRRAKEVAPAANGSWVPSHV
jgi:hypothetical protein